MGRLHGFVILALALTTSTATTLSQDASAPAFRTALHLVRLPVVVTGSDGAFVHGLSAGDFEVREDGDLQEVVTFAEGAGDGGPTLHLGVMLDRSNSMEEYFGQARAAVESFVKAFGAARSTTLVEFDHDIRTSTFAPEDYDALFRTMQEPRVGHATVFFDAVAAYASYVASHGGEHVLLIYSDGDDARSRLTLSQLQSRLRRTNLTAYAIGYLDAATAVTRFTAQYNLNAVARETGGRVFLPRSARELDDAYARILEEVRTRYTLGYIPRRASDDERFRRVTVTVRVPGDVGARARARSGYVAVRPAAP